MTPSDRWRSREYVYSSAAKMMGISGRLYDATFLRRSCQTDLCCACWRTSLGLLAAVRPGWTTVVGLKASCVGPRRLVIFSARPAVSSRGLGRSPLKAQTRVRIPLPLFPTLLRDAIFA